LATDNWRIRWHVARRRAGKDCRDSPDVGSKRLSERMASVGWL
jgi:hypothetical protein